MFDIEEVCFKFPNCLKYKELELHILRVLVVWLGLWSAVPAWGCRFVFDKRPLSVRLDVVPVAFIGTVTSVALDGKAEFQVEHLLRGKVEGRIFVVSNDGSSCDIRFSLGQRWIFGGAKVFHPSFLLAGSHQTDSSLIRINDSALSFSFEWQACDSDAVCNILPYGCTETAVNKEFLVTARKKAWLIGGNPRTMNCVSVQNNEFRRALCEKNKCGIWVLQPNGQSGQSGQAH